MQHKRNATALTLKFVKIEHEKEVDVAMKVTAHSAHEAEVS